MSEGRLNTTTAEIRSFQSIDELSFDITGFTCITGPSNIGKSAIIRAISGALLNSPSTGLVRKGRKFCSVDLRGLGWGVKWEKGENVGRYTVPGEESPRDGIGQGQTDITASLGFRSIKVGDERLSPWYAPQWSPIFLLNKSGPSITDFISDITRLKVLQDAVVLNVKSRQKALTEASVKEQDAASLRAAEERLSAVDSVLQLEADLVGQMESIREYEKSIGFARSSLESMERERAAVDSLSRISGLRVPPAIPEPRIQSMVETWGKLERAALSVVKVRGVASVQVPDFDAGPSVDALRESARFLDIGRLSRSVDLLGPVLSVPVPEPPDESVLSGLREASSILARVESARRSLGALSDVPEIPDPALGPEIASLSVASGISAAIAGERASIALLESDVLSIESSLSEVESELAAIPTCPACGQVTQPQHEHEESP